MHGILVDTMQRNSLLLHFLIGKVIGFVKYSLRAQTKENSYNELHLVLNMMHQGVQFAKLIIITRKLG